MSKLINLTILGAVIYFYVNLSKLLYFSES